jgi:hypothetical protein
MWHFFVTVFFTFPSLTVSQHMSSSLKHYQYMIIVCECVMYIFLFESITTYKLQFKVLPVYSTSLWMYPGHVPLLRSTFCVTYPIHRVLHNSLYLWMERKVVGLCTLTKKEEHVTIIKTVFLKTNIPLSLWFVSYFEIILTNSKYVIVYLCLQSSETF